MNFPPEENALETASIDNRKVGGQLAKIKMEDVTTGQSVPSEGPSHSKIIPVVITSVGVLCLVVVIVIILKICTFLRRRSLSAHRSLSQNHIHENQQKLPSGNNLKMCFCNPVDEDIFPSFDLDNMGIQEDYSEGDFAKHTENNNKLNSESSNSIGAQSEGEGEMAACSGEFILYNPQHEHEMTVEVEIHPEEYEMKQLELKDSDLCSYKGESFSCGGDIDTPLYV